MNRTRKYGEALPSLLADDDCVDDELRDMIATAARSTSADRSGFRQF